MEDNRPKKTGVHIVVTSEDDSDEDLSSAEAQAVKHKLEAHHIKQLGSLLKAAPLASVDGLLQKHLKPQLFAEAEGSYKLDVGIVVLHSGVWRWMPDFALRAAPVESGRVHCGLRVGPLVLDWTDSSLVSIRTQQSVERLVICEIATEVLYVGNDRGVVEKALRALAATTAEWNTKKKFGKGALPLQYVEEAAAALAAQKVVTVIKEGQMKELLIDMQKKGERIDVVFAADWVEEKKRQKKYKFKSHAEFDEWALALRKDHPDLETARPDEWNLLLTMDRCFWCGLEGQDTTGWSEKDRPREDGCAFGAPAFQKLMEIDLGSATKKSNVIRKKSTALIAKKDAE